MKSVIEELNETKKILEILAKSPLRVTAKKNKSKIDSIIKKMNKKDLDFKSFLKGPISDIYKLLVGKMVVNSSAERFFSKFEDDWNTLSNDQKEKAVNDYIDYEIELDTWRSNY